MAYSHLVYVQAAPANNMQSIIIPKTGKVIAVGWHVFTTPTGADFYVIAELSMAPTAMAGITGADNVISLFMNASDLTTSGVSLTGMNYYDGVGGGYHVSQGERIYVNASGTAITSTYSVQVFYDFTIGR